MKDHILHKILAVLGHLKNYRIARKIGSDLCLNENKEYAEALMKMRDENLITQERVNETLALSPAITCCKKL